MDRLFLIVGQYFVYWNSLLLVLSAAAGICALVSLHLMWKGREVGLALYVPCALVLSLVLGRLVHWYCLPNQYDGFLAAMTNPARGGYALMGPVAACLILALLWRKLGLLSELPRFLDCLSVAGCGAIAVGRLSFFYSSLDKGSIVKITTAPISYPVMDAVSGQVEYRFATFLFQAAVLGILFAAILIMLLRERRLQSIPAGDIALVFALCYCTIAVVLDSTRYDSLYFRSNGFVSVVQILSAVVVVGCTVIYSVRLIRADGMRRFYPLIWLLQLIMVGGAGFMEYYVQRHGREALFSYVVMSVCLADYVALTLLLRHWCLNMEHKKARNIYPDPVEK